MILLTALSATFAKLEPEFEVEPFEEVVEETFESELLGDQEKKGELFAFINHFDQKKYSVLETEDARFYVKLGEELKFSEEMEILFGRYVNEGSIAIDYGAENGLNTFLLSNHVGFTGKVLAFEPRRDFFREMYWNLSLNGVSNTKLYFLNLGQKEKTLDSFELENVSLIKIDAKGTEDIFLKGAEETIRKNRPVLIIKMLGGIPMNRSDRYVKEAYNARIEQIRNLGYSIQQIAGGDYLALP